MEFNKKVIAEFRENDGVCGGPFEGAPMILVTMTGAKSGRELCSPLVYSSDGDDAIIIASMGGAPKHPNWYHNLVANPAVTVEIGTAKYEATAVLAMPRLRSCRSSPSTRPTRHRVRFPCSVW